MAKSNIPAEVTTAIRAANSVERGQAAHHKALIALIVSVARMSEADAFATLTLYTSDRHEKSPDSLCTQATVAWMRKHFGVNVKNGVACKGDRWDGRGFTPETLAAAKSEPWFKLAADLAFKLPTALNMKAIASQAVKHAHMGEALPSKDELYGMFMDAVQDAAKSARVLDWCAEYDTRLAKGELPQVAAPATEGEAPVPDTAIGRAIAAARAAGVAV